MALPKVEFHPEAVEEARAAMQWYAERNSPIADAFLADLEQAVDGILEAPSRWAAYSHGTRRCLLRRFPYLVVFRSLGSAIQILAVAHAHRRPGYWKDRR